MKPSYKKLWILLLERDITNQKFQNEAKLAPATMVKLKRGEQVPLSVLLKICEYLDCNIGDICDAVKK